MTRLSLAALLALVGCIAIGIYRSRWVLTFDGKPCGWEWPWAPLHVPKLDGDRWQVFTAERPDQFVALSARAGEHSYHGPYGTVELYVAGSRTVAHVDWYSVRNVTHVMPRPHPWLMFADLPGAMFRLGCSGADDPRCESEKETP